MHENRETSGAPRPEGERGRSAKAQSHKADAHALEESDRTIPFRWAAILTGIVLLECSVLAANGGRCPLSDLAARFTDDRAHNFDIYLPNWLAQHNKVIFGALFVAGELVVLGCWLRERYQLGRRG